MSRRADIAVFEAGLAPSREKAQEWIRSGRIRCGDRVLSKPSEQINDNDRLQMIGDNDDFASRGGHKLEKALSVFSVDVSGTVAMDIGASTGGFTDVLLRHGAAHVYAIDVGTGQLDSRIREDERVTNMERTNARTLSPEMFDLRPSLAVMDVSFISVRLILPVLSAVMGAQGRIITLIKPQFEAGRKDVGKNGVVRNSSIHLRVLKEIRDFVPSIGLHVNALTFSPITGPAGNIEFLADLLPGTDIGPSDEALEQTVDRAHRELTR